MLVTHKGGVHFADVAGAALPFNGRAETVDRKQPLLIRSAPTAAANGDQVIWHVENALLATIGDRLPEKPVFIPFPSEPT